MSHRCRAFIVDQNGLAGHLTIEPIYFKHLTEWAKDVIRELKQDRLSRKMTSSKQF